jgi:hypothetical protein
MNPLKSALRREFRVAFSRRGQPAWFRVIKWTVILAGAARYHDRPWFWRSLAALALAGAVLHWVYRRKTKAWTRPWGGWNDVEAARN